MSVPEKAIDFCNAVSERAKDIKTNDPTWSENLTSLFNPQNWKTNAEMSTEMYQMFNINISSSEVQKIKNTCSNLTLGKQLNEINMQDCEYCQKNGCAISNISQTNIIESEQKCVMSALLDTLLKQTNSIDSQALSHLIQEAEGLLANSSYSSTNCNSINQNVSTEKFIEIANACSQQINLDQANILHGCGSVMDIIQSNQSQQYQECMKNSEIYSKTEPTQESDITQSETVEQSSSGLTFEMMAIIAGVILLVILLIFILTK